MLPFSINIHRLLLLDIEIRFFFRRKNPVNKQHFNVKLLKLFIGSIVNYLLSSNRISMSEDVFSEPNKPLSYDFGEFYSSAKLLSYVNIAPLQSYYHMFTADLERLREYLKGREVGRSSPIVLVTSGKC